ERGFGSLPSSTEANPRDQVKLISTTIEADSYPIRRIGSDQYVVSTGQDRTLMRNQDDNLMPTIEEGEVIEEFRTRNKDVDTGIDDYSSYYDYDKKILLENMDAYRDEGVGDIIVGEPFLREFRIKAKRFEGTITLYKDDKSITYQMVRSHPRFKRHTNEQCNKIPPLLKVSDEDKMNEISHPYQNLKGFYKGVLNLGPNYIQDARMEEWLIRGHISVHEME
nr:hypothetical protein [Tanacetum cinerariifolium]